LTYTIYADVLFVLNFAIDFICMCASLYICRLKRRVFPIILSSVAGGVYSVFALYLVNTPFLIQTIVHIFALFIMCLISTPSSDIKTILKAELLFLGVSAFAGGIVSVIFSYLGKYVFESGSIYADVSPLSLLSFVLFTAAFSIPFFVKTGKRIAYKTASVSLDYKSTKKRVDAFIDTGNLLSDPISGDGIILIKHTELSDVFKEEQMEALKALDVLSESFPTGIRLVPWEKGLLPVFRPDNTVIKLFGTSEKKTVSALIGIDFSSGSFGGSFGLLPSCYIN